MVIFLNLFISLFVQKDVETVLGAFFRKCNAKMFLALRYLQWLNAFALKHILSTEVLSNE